MVLASALMHALHFLFGTFFALSDSPRLPFSLRLFFGVYFSYISMDVTIVANPFHVVHNLLISILQFQRVNVRARHTRDWRVWKRRTAFTVRRAHNTCMRMRLKSMHSIISIAECSFFSVLPTIWQWWRRRRRWWHRSQKQTQGLARP